MAKFSLTSNLLPVTSVYAFRCLIMHCYILVIGMVCPLIHLQCLWSFAMVGCYIWWGIDKVTTCMELMYSKAPFLMVSPSGLEASFSMLILRQGCGSASHNGRIYTEFLNSILTLILAGFCCSSLWPSYQLFHIPLLIRWYHQPSQLIQSCQQV